MTLLLWGELIRFISKRIAPNEEDALADEVLQWIAGNFPAGYLWPGNIRELEQCVRNIIMIRNHYQPDPLDGQCDTPANQAERLARQIVHVELSADELLSQYARIAYEKTTS